MVYKRLERFLIQLDEVDSTNTFASNLIRETDVSSGTLIVSKNQLEGRGQRSNTWTAEPGKNLICTLIFKPSIRADKSFYLTISVSLAIRKTLEDLGIQAKIKWPNDILVGKKKICGVLIENSVSGSKIAHSLIGIGLNVNQDHFDQLPNATSVILEKEEVELEEVMNQLYGYLDFYLNLLEEGHFDLLKKHYHNFLFGLNELMDFEDEEGIFQGTIKRVDENGFLEVDKKGVLKKYELKQISFC